MKRKKKPGVSPEEDPQTTTAEATPEVSETLGEDSPEPLADEVAGLQQKIAEQDDRHLRLFAEFENYKKRNQRERLQLMETAGKKTMLALLPALDDFERARKAAEQGENHEQFDSGIGIIIKKLRTILEAQGLRAMTSTGEAFDADLHEAITEIPAPTNELKGKVVDTVETGYTLNGTIIRHAKVVVGK